MSEVQQLGSADTASMTPEQISAAVRAGQLTEYAAGRDPNPKKSTRVYEVEQYGGEWVKGRPHAEVDAAMQAGHLRAYLAGEIQ
ncbi:hypothetical protein [Streptomyces africanus]|uniref:hypothetical protein n=1 Tax=Streptomyces africanus TaxID=231024 RepID=UPI000A381CE4|nr:hypothetical protein [Streptomyces africanus]